MYQHSSNYTKFSWGHDFRPDYRKMTEFFRNFDSPIVPILALTATATPKTIEDIRKGLGVPDSLLFISTCVRPNLIYKTTPKSKTNFEKVMNDLKTQYPNKSGIVYCLSK